MNEIRLPIVEVYNKKKLNLKKIDCYGGCHALAFLGTALRQTS